MDLLGRVGARGVGIEIHHDALGVALERAHLGVGERRAAAGHHVVDARRIDADHVHVAFHQHRVVGLAHRILGAMQIVQHVALAIERRFGRVQILGLFAGSQRAAAEADHFAGFVVDREHQPAAKAIEESAAFLALQQPARTASSCSGAKRDSNWRINCCRRRRRDRGRTRRSALV